MKQNEEASSWLGKDVPKANSKTSGSNFKTKSMGFLMIWSGSEFHVCI